MLGRLIDYDVIYFNDLKDSGLDDGFFYGNDAGCWGEFNRAGCCRDCIISDVISELGCVGIIAWPDVNY